MALSSSDAFIVLNELLQDYDTELLKATERLTEIKIITKERSEVRDALEKLLASKKIPYGELTRNVGSFGGTEIETVDEKIRLIYKQKGNTGSGGGAEATRLTESAQCVYAAIAFGLRRHITSNDVTSANVNAYGKEFITDEKIEKILNDLNDVWIASCVLGAKKLWDKFKNKGTYTFNRGSAAVNKIEGNFKRVKKNEKVRMDINKWNPADIWLMTNEFVANQLSTLEEATTLETLNAKLQKYYDSGDCIGVSLKQITQGTGNWDLINNQGSLKDIDKVQFRGIHGTYDSIDFYIKWGVGGKDDIQFRNTAGDKKLQWQGEIKGVSAAQGKVGGGILDGILNKLGHTMIGVKNQHQRLKNATNPNSRQHAQGMSKTIYDKAKVHKLSGFKDDVNLISEIANESHSWRYSNYINYKLLDLVKSMSEEQKHKFVQAVYFYAASQSDLSSIHAKIK